MYLFEQHVLFLYLFFQQFELLELLKPREIERIRVFFRKYDSENTGRLPESLAFKAFDEWYLSLIKHTPDGPKSENWLQDGFMKRKISSSLLEQNSKLPKTISWTQFLKQHALHLISSRPNTVTQRPYVPLYTIDRDMDKLAEDPSSS